MSPETTVEVDHAVLEEARAKFRDFGFDAVDDLVSTALRDYLRRRSTLEQKHAVMRLAATDLAYQRVHREINEEFSVADADGLTDPY